MSDKGYFAFTHLIQSSALYQGNLIIPNLPEEAAERLLQKRIVDYWPGIFKFILECEQYSLKGSRVDILGYDDQNNMPVVLELKARPANEKDLAQLLRYMGAIEEESGSESVGCLICKDHNIRCQYALNALRNDNVYIQHYVRRADLPGSLETELQPHYYGGRFRDVADVESWLKTLYEA